MLASLKGPGFIKGLDFFSKSYSTRLTKEERNSFIIPCELHDVLIGTCLGDLHISRRNINSYLHFHQGLINKEYLYHLFELFSKYSNYEAPIHKEYLNNKSNKIFNSIFFNTLSLPCFNYYHELFYVDKIKIVPLNIGKLLNSRSLAYWAMDDGSKIESGFHLNTNSFTLSDVQLLIKVLKENFDLNCTYHNKGRNQYLIYIRTESMIKFRSLVSPYFHESMMYKLTV